MHITIDPQELMNVAAHLAGSARELADVGSTLRSCTACEMPASVRSSVDAIVAMADRVLDEMAVGLRGEVHDLVRRAILTAIDMDLAAGLTVDQIRAQVGLPPTTGVALIGGSNWGTITSAGSLPSGAGIIGGSTSGSGGGGGTYAIAAAIDASRKRQKNILDGLAARGATIPAGSFPMPGARSLSSLPTFSNPMLQMSEHVAIGKEEARTGNASPI